MGIQMKDNAEIRINKKSHLEMRLICVSWYRSSHFERTSLIMESPLELGKTKLAVILIAQTVQCYFKRQTYIIL